MDYKGYTEKKYDFEDKIKVKLAQKEVAREEEKRKKIINQVQILYPQNKS